MHAGTHSRIRISVQVIERDRRAPECHTWALVWSEDNRGWQNPTLHCPSFHYGDKSPPWISNALPGPAHTLTSLCASCVETVCMGCVCVCVGGKKYALTLVSINPRHMCVLCRLRARVSARWTEQLVPGGGRPLSTGTQTRVFVCEKQSSLWRS